MSHSTQGALKVSVVCAWYNRANYLRDTIDSLLAQDFQDYEIVIVNDGSTDPRVKSILDSYTDPRLIVIHQLNTGFVGAIGKAISVSSAPYIAIQGAGDISLKCRIKEQYNVLSNNSNIVGVGCLVRSTFISDEGCESNLRLRTPKKMQITRHDFKGRRNPFSHGEVMFRRSVYGQVGGYRDIFKFAQDRDLWLRMSECGDFIVCNNILYTRRIFKFDGVSTDFGKLVIQRRFSLFARQCATKKDIDGYDYVDIYGHQAMLMYRPDILFEDFIFKEFLKCIALRNRDMAVIIYKFSLMQRSGFFSCLSVQIQKIILYTPFLSLCVRSILRFYKYNSVSVEQHDIRL